MSDVRKIDMFTGRLRTLSRLLDIAAAQWDEAGRDTADLVAARLADDMFSLGAQVALACRQADSLAAFALDRPDTRPSSLPESSSFADLTALIDGAIANLDEARTAGPMPLAAEKRVDLPGSGLHLEMPGEAYVDDWLLPHFYFHVVTAYAILRQSGVKIGKADYMAHLGPYLRGMPTAKP